MSVWTVALFSLGFSACSDELNEGKKEPADKAYISIRLELPSETRSGTLEGGTSTGGEEPGSELENALNTATLYLVNADNDMLILPMEASISGSGSNFMATSVVNLQSFCSILEGKKFKIYIVANSDEYISGELTSATLNHTTVMSFGETGQSIPMSSKTALELNFNGKSASDIKDMFSRANDYTLNLGKVQLERIVARLDYKDAERGVNIDLPATPNLYPLGATGLYLKVVAMQPVNVSHKSYLFKHTSTGSTTMATGIPTLFGTEGPSSGAYNWVADCDWTLEKGSYIKTGNFIDSTVPGSDPSYFISSWTSVNSLTASDNLENSGYHPWCYISENTLPSIAQMKEGVTTGVAFKTILCNSNGEAISTDLEFNNVIIDLSSQNPSVTVNGKKRNIFKEEDNSYSLTYFYWIRHDDNERGNETGPMEFSVVRNNIYKLSIKSFSSLPREYNPDDEAEPKMEDVSLEVKVKPWGYNGIRVDL